MILPISLSTSCLGEPLVGLVPVSPILTVYDLLYHIKLPCSFSHVLRLFFRLRCLISLLTMLLFLVLPW